MRARRDSIKSFLRFLVRIGLLVCAVMIIDAIGLWLFITLTGHRSLFYFSELLALLLLLEGAFVGVAGGFMFLGYSEYRIARQHAINPVIVGDQRQKWKERRLSQQKWGFAMLVAGMLMIFLALLISYLTFS